jgi:parallel beta-helix repeat protein
VDGFCADNCANLTTPNYIYNLTMNSSSSSGTCINIWADNVTVDCNGYSIVGIGDLYNFGGIFSNASNSTIRNCNVSGGFEWGLFMFHANHGHVYNSNFSSTLQNGIDTQNASYITFDNVRATGVHFGLLFDIGLGGGSHNNTVMNSVLIGSPDLELTSLANGNSFINVTANTIVLLQADSNSFENVTANTMSIFGNGNRISHSNAGISFLGASNNSVESSSLNSISFAPNMVWESSDNNITNNTLTGGSFSLSSASSGNRFIGNTLSGGDSPIILYSGAANNVFLRNNLTAATTWVYNEDPSNIFNDSTAGNIYYFANGTPSWNVFNITDTTGDGWADEGSSLPFNATTVGGSWSGFGADWHPYTTNHLVNSCMNITAAGSYAQTANISSTSGGRCINITASNVNYTCAGKSITVNGSWAAGIYSNGTNNTMANCIIDSILYGIILENSSYNTVRNMSISAAQMIWAPDSQYANITQFYSNPTVGLGIYLEGSSNSYIANSYVNSSSGDPAFRLGVGIDATYGSNNNTVENVAGRTPYSTGDDLTSCFSIQSLSSGNTLRNITCWSQNGSGLDISADANNNRITNSNFTSDASEFEGSTAYTISNFGSNISLINSTIRGTTGIVCGGNSSFFLNNTITAGIWMDNRNETNTFNDSVSGNAYYFANGTPAWAVFNITDVAGTGWADSGSGRPFNATTVGGNWTGLGGDWHPYTQIRAGITLGNASSINTTGLSNISAVIGSANATNGSIYSGVAAVSIYSGGLPMLSFSFNFSGNSLDFSQLNITAGNLSGASYMVVNGTNSSGGQSGTKNITIYGASTSFNGICIKDAEGIGVTDISSSCNETSETSLQCDGSTSNGYSCSLSGTTLTVSGLQHSAVKQYGSASTSQAGGGTSKKAAALSNYFDCASNMLSIYASYLSEPISGLELGLLKSGLQYSSNYTGSGGNAQFSIATAGSYRAYLTPNPTYYADDIQFDLQLCQPQPPVQNESALQPAPSANATQAPNAQNASPEPHPPPATSENNPSQGSTPALPLANETDQPQSGLPLAQSQVPTQQETGIVLAGGALAAGIVLILLIAAALTFLLVFRKRRKG